MAENNITSQVWTKNLTSGQLVIDASYGFTVLSILALSGATGTIQGSLTRAGSASDALALQEGIPLTITSAGNYPLDEITINWSAGTIQIIGR